ncbi:hypothetical protein [Sphingobacterium sp. SYP-B4668]|uniref:hypothetical protein n=1 Tax=Sphingobacterium sp. SYP-B4668 TaxID=2996035 RepID=UPI0022DD7386|nr:hypothetical protein [Sphingobacterium sp. SYP-B4668]
MLDPKKNNQESEDNQDYPGYPHYSAKEDIFSKETRVLDEELGQEPLSKTDERSLDEGLDVPGSELDDDQEEIGSEDEENNYYSLGGDNHEDLEQSEDF